jgi:hypothetical protein
MPRVSALQEKYADRGVVAIAVTSLDGSNSRDDVKEAIQDLDNSLSPRFRIAIDGGPNKDATVAAYLNAARETGIPRTFIIDQKGRIAWIGHPQDAERVVEAVQAGTWDIEAAARRRRRDTDERTASRALISEWIDARTKNDQEGEVAALRKLAIMQPENVMFSPPFSIDARFAELLADQGRREEAEQVVDAAMKKEEFRKEPWAVSEFARSLRPVSDHRARELAALAEEELVRRGKADPSTDVWDRFIQEAQRSWEAQAYDVLADFWDRSGDAQKAASLMEQCVAMSDKRFKEYYKMREQRLEEYRRRANAGPRASCR